MRITVTGARGFLGRHLFPVLDQVYDGSVVAVSREDYDLTNPGAVRAMFGDLKPDVLIHLAAYVGGIGANRDYPADFFYRNTLLTALVFEEAARFGLRKLIYPMGGCSYPAAAKSPIDESQMWDGFPQPESAPYSVAKKLSLIASDAYRRQYGLNSVVIIPGNMYGEYDNFSRQGSHVIPGLIRRFYEAKLAAEPEVVVWGSGSPVRDFVYAGDVAAVIPFFIENYDFSEPVNLSSGTTTSIKDLAETVQRLVQYPGRIVWDRNKPDGQKIKIFDVSRMKRLGLACPTPLESGLKKTITWFCENYSSQTDGIRLQEAVSA